MSNNRDLISSPTAYARFAGFNYLMIMVLAIFANLVVLPEIIVRGDAAATMENLTQNESLFRLGLASSFAVLIADIFVAWSLYLLMKGVNPHLSLLSTMLRMTYVIAHIGVVLNFSQALQLSASSELFGTLSSAHQGVWLYFSVVAHNQEFTYTLIFFGLHLLVLGFLIFRSAFLPALIGGLVMIAGAGYVVNGFAEVLFDGYGVFGNLTLYVMMLPALIGEGALTLWLLIRGINRRKWDEAYA